jgi:hypothetical protein
MDLAADALLSFSRPIVFAAYRDKLVDLLPFLPNVRRIEVKSRVEEDGLVKLVNEWHGGGEIPAVARAFVSEAMLTWTDRASWNEAKWICDWTIETHAFTEAVTCKGRNTFLEQDGKTKLEIRGTLGIDAKKVKGVPSLLAGKVGKAVEEVLINKIQPNLVEVSRGLAKYLEEQHKGA